MPSAGELTEWRVAVGRARLEEMRDEILSTDFNDPASVAGLNKKVASWIAGGQVPSRIAARLESAIETATKSAKAAKRHEDSIKAAAEAADRLRGKSKDTHPEAIGAPEGLGNLTTQQDVDRSRQAAVVAGTAKRKTL